MTPVWVQLIHRTSYARQTYLYLWSKGDLSDWPSRGKGVKFVLLIQPANEPLLRVLQTARFSARGNFEFVVKFGERFVGIQHISNRCDSLANSRCSKHLTFMMAKNALAETLITKTCARAVYYVEITFLSNCMQPQREHGRKSYSMFNSRKMFYVVVIRFTKISEKIRLIHAQIQIYVTMFELRKLPYISNTVKKKLALDGWLIYQTQVKQCWIILR